MNDPKPSADDVAAAEKALHSVAHLHHVDADPMGGWGAVEDAFALALARVRAERDALIEELVAALHRASKEFGEWAGVRASDGEYDDERQLIGEADLCDEALESAAALGYPKSGEAGSDA